MTMRRAMTGVLLALLSAGLGTGRAADVYGIRVAPPRLYLTHASINKSGVLSALRGQDNVISLYMPPVDISSGAYAPEGFSLVALLPGFVEVLDQAEQGLTVTPVEHEGQPYLQVAKALDPAEIRNRCFDNVWGLNEAGPLWYRIREGGALPEALATVRVSLRYRDKECFTDSARLRVYAAIQPGPRVSWRSFHLWLHYGPHYRPGHWDELALSLRLAGINSIQATVGGAEALEYVREMRQRGFYMIAQRGGSYEGIYRDNMRACLEQGPAWFAQADQGTMQTYLPTCDAALWDYEPSPLPTGVDEWLLGQFRQAQHLPADQPLTEATIRATYLRAWIDFRQQQLATCIKHWASYCRSVKPDVETILTEGGVLAFDPPGQVDYSRYQDEVTFCDPMNFTGMQALQVVRQWQQRAPRATFTGCQNVALSAYHSVFISAPTIMLQTLSAALIGQRGTSVYPGPALDAENFVLWARVTEFLGRYEQLIFAGRRDPAEVKLALLPKEEQDVTLGDGRQLRNCYPDWEREAIWRAYAATAAGEYLTVVANWHAKEPAYGRLELTLPAGAWVLVDDEHRQVLTRDGRPQVDAGLLAAGVYVRCPAFDYRGFRVAPASAAALGELRDYQPQRLEAWEEEARAYGQAAATAGSAAAGDLKLGFDDVDRDGVFEYVVRTAAQRAWVSQNGTVLRWEVGAQTLEGEALGLCRDMLWLPLGERENRGMDAVMRLEGKQAQADGIRLTFSKDVPLASLGGGASVRVVKELEFATALGALTVRVRLANTSVAPEATQLACSYRVHHYLKYGPAANVFWASDGTTLRRWDNVEANLALPNAGLSARDTECLFTQCEVATPGRVLTCGDYRPESRVLLKATPARPQDLLQLLRWGRRAGVPGGATLEWMYTPATLAVGQDLSYEYSLALQPDVASLEAPAATTPGPALGPAKLLFHLSFDGTTEPVTAGGAKEVTVSGVPTYEDSPDGKAIRISQGVSLSYLPAGNIDLQRGRIAIRFKPLWEGADNLTHFLLTVRPRTGFVYVGRIDDGRLLMNLFDAKEGQHYAAHMVRTLPAATWHEAVFAWDATRGTSFLFLDGEKVAESRAEPWEMAEVDNALAPCRLVFPKEAEAVIDDVKIWDRP